MSAKLAVIAHEFVRRLGQRSLTFIPRWKPLAETREDERQEHRVEPLSRAPDPASGHEEFRVERSVLVLGQNGTFDGDPLPLLELARRPESVILIGDPGMGKSTALAEVGAHLRTRVRQVRTFVATTSQPDTSPDIVLLDALDEAMSIGVIDPLASVAAHIEAAGNPRFWLTCRAIDWVGQSGAALLENCAPKGLIVARLLSLEDVQIKELVVRSGIDAEDLFATMQQANLLPLLRNPWTLRLVLDVTRQGIPRSRHDLFHRAAFLLTRERTDRPRQHLAATVSSEDLIDAAGAAFATLLFSGQGAITLTPDRSDAVSFQALQPLIPEQRLRSTVATRLFAATGDGDDSWESQHRTMAEFLAAQFLANQVANSGLPLGRVIALLCGSTPLPHASLRGVFAWLASLLPARAEELVTIDPYGIVSYGDPTCLPPAAKRALLETLSLLAQQEPWFRGANWEEARFGALAVPELVMDLAQIIDERPVQAQLFSCVCDAVVEGEACPGLRNNLEALLSDNTVPTGIRSGAVAPYFKVTEAEPSAAVAFFQRLLVNPAFDPSAEISGRFFLRLYPSQLGSAELIAFLERYVEAAPDTDPLHITYFLPKLIPPESDAQTLDQFIASSILGGDAEPLSRLAYVQRMAGKLAVTALAAVAQGDGARVASWTSVMKRDHFDQETERDLQNVSKVRPDLFIPILKIATLPLSDKELTGAPLLAAQRMWMNFRWFVPPENAADMLFDAMSNERDLAVASRLFAAALSYGITNVASFERAWKLGHEQTFLKPILDAFCAPMTIASWQKEHAEQAATIRASAAARDAATVNELTNRIDGIRAGADEWALGLLTGYWYNMATFDRRVGDLSTLPPPDRLRILVSHEIATAAEQGFREFAVNSNAPTPAQLAECAIKNSTPFYYFAALAGAGLLCSDFEPSLPPLSPVKLSNFLCFVLAMKPSDRASTIDERAPWVRNIISSYTEESIQAIRELLLPQFEASQDHISELYELCTDSVFDTIRPRILPELLNIAHNPNVFRSLIDAALSDLPNELLNQIVAQRLSGTSVPSERWPWLHLAWRLNPGPHEEEVRLLLTSDTSFDLSIAEATGESIGGGGLAVPLQVKHRVLIVRLLAPRYAPVPIGGSKGGFVTPQMQISRVVERQFERLATMMDIEAESVLIEASTDALYSVYQDHAKQSLATWRRESYVRGWEKPPAELVIKALANGLPATGADLLAFSEQHLRDINRSLRTTAANLWHEFWNLDRGRPTTAKTENDARDGLVRLLMSRFEIAGISQATEVRRSGDDRCDIVASTLQRNLPIEVKCDWNNGLWTAWKTQLAERYACEPRAGGLGIYLVFWFGDGRGASRHLRPPPSGETPRSATELEELLHQIIKESRLTIQVVVMDVRPPG